MDRDCKWYPYRRLEALRPPLVVLCLLAGLFGFYVLRVLLWEKRDRDRRRGDADGRAHSIESSV